MVICSSMLLAPERYLNMHVPGQTAVAAGSIDRFYVLGPSASGKQIVSAKH
jgi:hypothetical protein